MPKKVIKKKPSTQKVDLSTLEFFELVNLSLILMFGVIGLIFLENLSNKTTRIRADLVSLENRVREISYDANSASDNSYSAKIYSRELYKQSLKKAAKK